MTQVTAELEQVRARAKAAEAQRDAIAAIQRRIVAARGDLQLVMDEIARQAYALLGATRGGVFLLEPDGRMRMVAGR